MSNIVKVVDDLKSIAARFKGIIQIVDALEKIGSIEQAERDANTKKDRAYKESQEAEKALSIKKSSLDKLENEFVEHERKAEAIVTNARMEATKIIDSAGIRANEIISGSMSRKMEVEKDISNLISQRTFVNQQIADKTNELNDINEKIEEAKKKVAALFKN